MRSNVASESGTIWCGSSNHPRLNALLALVLAVLGTVCGGPAGDSRGAAASIFNDPRLTQWKISDAPDFVIGAPDEREGYAFGRVADALVLDDRIVVADAGFGEIRTYSLSGDLISRSGRMGGGPGEYRAIRSLARHADTVVVWDVQLMRLVLLSRHGSVARTISPDLSAATGLRPVFVGLTKEGSIVFRDYRSPWSLRNAPTGERRDSVWYILLWPDGKSQEHTWSEPGTEEYFTNREGSWGSMPIIFGRSLFETIAAGRLVVAVNDSLVFRQVRADGSIERSVAFQWTPGPVSDDWVGTKRQHLLDELDDGSGLLPPGMVIDPPSQEKMVDRVEAQILDLPSRQTLPAFGDLQGDAVGGIWIAEYPLPDTRERRWVVLDSALAPIANVAVPPTMHILDIGRDFIVSRKADELGRESVAVYRIVR